MKKVEDIEFKMVLVFIVCGFLCMSAIARDDSPEYNERVYDTCDAQYSC